MVNQKEDRSTAQKMIRQIILLTQGLISAEEMGIPSTGYETQIFAYITFAKVIGDNEITRRVRDSLQQVVDNLKDKKIRGSMIRQLDSEINILGEMLPEIPPIESPVKLLPRVQKRSSELAEARGASPA